MRVIITHAPQLAIPLLECMDCSNPKCVWLDRNGGACMKAASSNVIHQIVSPSFRQNDLGLGSFNQAFRV